MCIERKKGGKQLVSQLFSEKVTLNLVPEKNVLE
jgi:hypothetical protein